MHQLTAVQAKHFCARPVCWRHTHLSPMMLPEPDLPSCFALYLGQGTSAVLSHSRCSCYPMVVQDSEQQEEEAQHQYLSRRSSYREKAAMHTKDCKPLLLLTYPRGGWGRGYCTWGEGREHGGVAWLCRGVVEGFKQSLLRGEGGLRRTRLCLETPRNLERRRPDVQALRSSSCLTSSWNRQITMLYTSNSISPHHTRACDAGSSGNSISGSSCSSTVEAKSLGNWPLQQQHWQLPQHWRV